MTGNGRFYVAIPHLCHLIMPSIMTPLETYRQRADTLAAELDIISRRCSTLSTLRLLAALSAIVAGWFFTGAQDLYLLVVAVLCAALFFFLVKKHSRAVETKQFTTILLQINREELAYLAEGKLSFADGSRYMEAGHPYTGDLDIFGARSLYQHLNRTGTCMGSDQLAEALSAVAAPELILRRQEAVDELAKGLDERHKAYTLARIAGDDRAQYERLLHWLRQEPPRLSPVLNLLSYLMPAVLAAVALLYFITRDKLYTDLLLRLVPANLLLFSMALGSIRKAIAGTDKAFSALNAYAAIFDHNSRASFHSPLLRELQQRLSEGNESAGSQVKRLGKVLADLETVQNPFAAVIMNGLFFYHIHALRRLQRWKKVCAGSLPQWLDVIAALEMLQSFANFRYNNPDGCFPQLNGEQRIAFSALGHPLIPRQKRVCNDISFVDRRFVILTGSNMSGKSTFLRSLGVNMVLAGAGAPVCAASAQVHPLPVLASMRQSDSLADAESYFFAEVKRLKYIMDRLASEPCFVLLDEILRGTNSDDKRSGTLGVIRNMLAFRVTGAIATHDLEVCAMADEHPAMLSNQCFEVEITDDELVFDYRLRPGICKNKSATFLMKKMKIIG